MNDKKIKEEKKYIPVIGLEIHVELKTESKMFCQCSAKHFGVDPNTNVCPVCLGLPGALPVANQKAIELTFELAKTLKCKLNKKFKFDRKSYFYPDLPKGFQISQYDQPIGYDGELEFYDRNQKLKKFRIRRVHLEEDTAKSIHKKDNTFIDFNRSGVPLCEIVTEPDFSDPEDVKSFLEELQTTIKLTQVSDAEMDKGSMRAEPSISVRIVNKDTDEFKLPNYKVEVKNINSISFAKYAVEFEIKRQTKLLKEGKKPIQETRGYSEASKTTVSQRVKENANDYRYFPEPNLPTFDMTDTPSANSPYNKTNLTKNVIDELNREYKVKFSDAFTLTRNKDTTVFFLGVMKEIPSAEAQSVANLIVNKKLSIDQGIKDFIKKYKALNNKEEAPTEQLISTIKEVMKENESVVLQYKNGKTSVIMFLIGQAMRKLQGKANPNKLKELFEKEIGK